MNTSPSDPAKQPVPVIPLLLTFGLVAYILAGLAVAQSCSRVLGLIMLAPVIIFMLTWFRRLPPELQARIGAKMKEQEQAPFGRFMRVVEIVIWALLGYALLAWLFQRSQ